jgi:hypothetical protein
VLAPGKVSIATFVDKSSLDRRHDPSEVNLLLIRASLKRYRHCSVLAHALLQFPVKFETSKETRSQQPALTEQKLNDVWNKHLRAEFSAHSSDGTVGTMVSNPRVKEVPVNRLR